MWAAAVGLVVLALGAWLLLRLGRIDGLYLRCWRCDKALVHDEFAGFEGEGKYVCAACVQRHKVRPWKGK